MKVMMREAVLDVDLLKLNIRSVVLLRMIPSSMTHLTNVPLSLLKDKSISAVATVPVSSQSRTLSSSKCSADFGFEFRFTREMWFRRIVISFCLLTVVCGKEAWQKPGCHKVGNTRRISIPDCVEFSITTNACRGYCESYAVPSIPWGFIATIKNPKPVVSIGQCCNIMESEDVGLLLPFFPIYN